MMDSDNYGDTDICECGSFIDGPVCKTCGMVHETHPLATSAKMNRIYEKNGEILTQNSVINPVIGTTTAPASPDENTKIGSIIKRRNYVHKDNESDFNAYYLMKNYLGSIDISSAEIEREILHEYKKIENRAPRTVLIQACIYYTLKSNKIAACTLGNLIEFFGARSCLTGSLRVLKKCADEGWIVPINDDEILPTAKLAILEGRRDELTSVLNLESMLITLDNFMHAVRRFYCAISKIIITHDVTSDFSIYNEGVILWWSIRLIVYLLTGKKRSGISQTYLSGILGESLSLLQRASQKLGGLIKLDAIIGVLGGDSK